MSPWHELPRPFVLGHRGVRGPAQPVENTLAAIAAAHSSGAHGVALDVRPCATGELVVLHDARLRRPSAGVDERLVASVEWASIRALDLGGGERVPRLEEALALCLTTGLALNVELKHDVPSLWQAARAAARVLQRHDRQHPILVSSFDPRMLAAFRRLAPRVPVALLVHRDGPAMLAGPRRAAWAARALGAIALHPERTLVAPGSLAIWRARGLGVAVWTVDDPREAVDLAALGIDGLICDEPAAVLAALGA